ncbi:MAG TPA: crosslink repair DNA glycosylase YcaQ family protein [Thermoplasmata archaeon]|nr:crosslink repair DNA glycosylase YcaQ family protein [Thermoplasmata archaeon]
MSEAPIATSLESVRRLTVTKQRLSGPLPRRPSTSAILSVVRDLAYVQWDPVSVVAPSHLLSLWARLGEFRPSDLDRLLWTDRELFLHWTPMASIVLTEDFPLYHELMRRYPDSLSHSWGSQRTQAKRFLSGHSELRTKILRELRKGPRRRSEFEDHARTKRSVGEWSFGSDVSQMLYHLTMSGDVMVVGHEGNQNLWGLSAPFLGDRVDRTELTEAQAARAAAERALRALGTASPREITYHFVRGRYSNIRETLAGLREDSVIHRVIVPELGPRDERYVHDSDLRLLESMDSAAWRPRLSLLPPFDNLVYSTARTNLLFGFDYVREQFLPKEKRKFGTYVLPILWGERLIGRLDPRFDRAQGELVINSVHAEPGAPADREVGEAIAATVHRLAAFLGATRVTYTARIPGVWKRSLR